jgi:hypothetical protein
VEAVGDEAKFFENGERGLEGRISFLPESAGVGFAGFNNKVIGSFFEEYGKRQSRENERDHDDH